MNRYYRESTVYVAHKKHTNTKQQHEQTGCGLSELVVLDVAM